MVVGCGESQGGREGRKEGREGGKEGGKKERKKVPLGFFSARTVLFGGGACFRYMNRIYVPALVP